MTEFISALLRGITMATILIVEDNRNLAKTIAHCLSTGDGHRCHCAHTGQDGLELFQRLAPDAIVLDLMLPDFSGLEVCVRIREASLRQRSHPPAILMLTAKTTILDRVSGYNMGANAYLSKPFEPDELLACLRAQLRDRWQRTEMAKFELIQTPHFRIDAEQYRVEKRQPFSQNWVILPLSVLRIKVLATLASRPGRVWSRQALIDQAWDTEREASDEAVRSCIKHLREQISDHRNAYIETVYDAGYKFEDANED